MLRGSGTGSVASVMSVPGDDTAIDGEVLSSGVMRESSYCGWRASLNSVSRAGRSLVPFKWLKAVRPVAAGWKQCPFLWRGSGRATFIC